MHFFEKLNIVCTFYYEYVCVCLHFTAKTYFCFENNWIYKNFDIFVQIIDGMPCLHIYTYLPPFLR